MYPPDYGYDPQEHVVVFRESGIIDIYGWVVYGFTPDGEIIVVNKQKKIFKTVPKVILDKWQGR